MRPRSAWSAHCFGQYKNEENFRVQPKLKLELLEHLMINSLRKYFLTMEDTCSFFGFRTDLLLLDIVDNAFTIRAPALMLQLHFIHLQGYLYGLFFAVHPL